MNNWKLKIKTILLAPQNMKYLGINMMKDRSGLMAQWWGRPAGAPKVSVGVGPGPEGGENWGLASWV